MKRMFGNTAMWVAMTLAVAAVAFAAGQDPKLPEGDGKKLVEDVCASCHSLDPIVRNELDKDSWKDVVLKMQGYGATIDDKQLPVIVDYLAKNFGPKKAAAQAPAGGTDAQAKDLMDNACSACHDTDLIKGIKESKQGWTDIVKSMVSKGAALDDKQMVILIDYLTKTYGK